MFLLKSIIKKKTEWMCVIALQETNYMSERVRGLQGRITIFLSMLILYYLQLWVDFIFSLQNTHQSMKKESLNKFLANM